MKIRFTRTTTVVEEGFVEIADDTPGLAEYLKAAANGFGPRMVLDPAPKEWTQVDRRVEITGKAVGGVHG